MRLQIKDELGIVNTYETVEAGLSDLESLIKHNMGIATGEWERTADQYAANLLIGEPVKLTYIATHTDGIKENYHFWLTEQRQETTQEQDQDK